jgi:pilus assembly protein CpaF
MAFSAPPRLYFDLLQAMTTGHQGMLATIHANSAPETLTRLATCVTMSGVQIPHRTVREEIAAAVRLVIHTCHTSSDAPL